MHIRKIIFEHSLNAVCGFSGAVFFFLDDDHQAKLEWKKNLLVPPDGYDNVDGMVGADIGINVTLQKHHTISGPDYIRQRQAFGLSRDDMFALIFVVPPE